MQRTLLLIHKTKTLNYQLDFSNIIIKAIFVLEVQSGAKLLITCYIQNNYSKLYQNIKSFMFFCQK